MYLEGPLLRSAHGEGEGVSPRGHEVRSARPQDDGRRVARLNGVAGAFDHQKDRRHVEQGHSELLARVHRHDHHLRQEKIKQEKIRNKTSVNRRLGE